MSVCERASQWVKRAIIKSLQSVSEKSVTSLFEKHTEFWEHARNPHDVSKWAKLSICRDECAETKKSLPLMTLWKRSLFDYALQFRLLALLHEEKVAKLLIEITHTSDFLLWESNYWKADEMPKKAFSKRREDWKTRLKKKTVIAKKIKPELILQSKWASVQSVSFWKRIVDMNRCVFFEKSRAHRKTTEESFCCFRQNERKRKRKRKRKRDRERQRDTERVDRKKSMFYHRLPVCVRAPAWDCASNRRPSKP